MDGNVINSFSLVGNIAKINDVLEQKNGTKFRYITLAQNNKYNNKKGEVVNNATFFDVKIFEKDFDKFETILEVGKFINIFGKIRLYVDENNNKNFILVGKEVRNLDKEKNKIKEEIFDYDWLNDI